MKIPNVRGYPKEITINGEVYLIKFVRKVRKDAATTGECCPEGRVIRIKLGQSLTETFNTFIHEVLHAIEFEYNIEIPHKAIYEYEKGISDFLMSNF